MTKLKNTLRAAKRLGMQHCPWMGDWFVSHSPRNCNSNAEGTWHHWANLAAMILSDPRTQAVAPDLYRPDLKPDESMYTEGNTLPDEMLPKGEADEDEYADGRADDPLGMPRHGRDGG
jgi:hypothetical protein